MSGFLYTSKELIKDRGEAGSWRHKDEQSLCLHRKSSVSWDTRRKRCRLCVDVAEVAGGTNSVQGGPGGLLRGFPAKVAAELVLKNEGCSPGRLSRGAEAL